MKALFPSCCIGPHLLVGCGVRCECIGFAGQDEGQYLPRLFETGNGAGIKACQHVQQPVKVVVLTRFLDVGGTRECCGAGVGGLGKMRVRTCLSHSDPVPHDCSPFLRTGVWLHDAAHHRPDKLHPGECPLGKRTNPDTSKGRTHLVEFSNHTGNCPCLSLQVRKTA